MKTATKISISIIFTALTSAAVFSGLSYWQSRIALQDSAFADVEALRDAKADQIEAFFQEKALATQTIAANPQTVSALHDLQAAFQRINQGGEIVLADESSIVRDYYERRILPRIAKYTGEDRADYNVYGPKTRAARHLQNIFIVQPPSSRPPGRNTYAAAHAFYDAPLKSLAGIYGFSDLYLIDSETGNIIYSASKNVDFGTDIVQGIYSGSALGDVIEQVAADGKTHISDIDLYLPAGNMAAAFIASPVYKDGAIIGILALQMEASEVSALSASGIKGRTDRDVYLVGGDKLMRSNAPFAQDNLNAYIRLLQRADIDEDVTAKVKLGKSTILAQYVNTDAVNAALGGQTGAILTENYFGQTVAAAYAPVNVGENDWVIIAERNATDIFAPLDLYIRQLAIAAAIFFPLLILLAVWTGWRMMRPARRFMESAANLVDGNNILFPEDKTEWGRIGTEFNKYIGRDPWELSLTSAPKRRERRTRSPIQLVAIDIEDPPAPKKTKGKKPQSRLKKPVETDSDPKPGTETKTSSPPKPDQKIKTVVKAEPEPASKPELTRKEKRALAKAEKQAKARAEKEAVVDARMKVAEEKRARIEAERKAKAEAREKAEADRQAKIEAEIEARKTAREKAVAERSAQAEAKTRALEKKKSAAEAERKAKVQAREKAAAYQAARAEADIKAGAEARETIAEEQKSKAEARDALEEQQRRAAEIERKAKADVAREVGKAVETRAEARRKAARKLQQEREARIAENRPIKTRIRAARSDVPMKTQIKRAAPKRTFSEELNPKAETPSQTLEKAAPKTDPNAKPTKSKKKAVRTKSNMKTEADANTGLKAEDVPPLTNAGHFSRLRRRRR